MADQERVGALLAAKGAKTDERKRAFFECPLVRWSEVAAGQVSLEWKTTPTCETPDMQSKPCLTKYADSVDVGPLQARLRAGEPHIWTAEGQHSNDLSSSSLRRAYHDSLGIEKIIFAFSDDIFTQSFRLPWWYSWAELLEPLFAAAGVRPQQVVRCLLARMPPDCLIDVHHDTGRWTTRTHRMHIPVFTEPSQVAFLAGSVAEAMQRFEVPVGSIFELNNRSKHAVYNGWQHHRVHLIFDWLEDLEAETPPLIFRDLTTADRGVCQFRRALWYYDAEHPFSSLPQVPNAPPTSPKREFRRLLQLLPADLSAPLSDQLARLILSYDQGEVLAAPLLALLRASYPALFDPAHFAHFVAIFADCLTDSERRFSWLRDAVQ